jgi:cysteine synthase A
MHVLNSRGGITEQLTLDMVGAARVISAATGAYWTDQLRNADQVAAYHRMAAEIWEQAGGRVDAFVQSVGTGATVTGSL